MTTVAPTSTSVTRAFDLIGLIEAAEPRGATLAELAGEAPMAKSSVLRYLTTLTEIGAVRRDEAGRFRLGLRLVELAGGLLENDDLRSIAEPLLHDLVAVSGETVHLGVRTGADVVYIAKVESKASVRLVSRIGSRVPIHCSAMGKAILAHLPEDERAPVFGSLQGRTPNTITSPKALASELDRVRERGFSIDDEENELGVRCVGAAVTASSGEPLGAISISGPAVRVSLKRTGELGPRVIETANEVARRLGHRAAANGGSGKQPAAGAGGERP
jgi:DNA-binding IclR family transcriptional regulator